MDRLKPDRSSHPLAHDPNWLPEAEAYYYYDEKLNDVWHSSQPKSDSEAFQHYVDIWGKEPAMIRARRHDGTVEDILWNLKV